MNASAIGEYTQEQKVAIRHSQNQLLYSGIKYSAAGSLAAAVVLVYTFAPHVSHLRVNAWFAVIALVYIARICDLAAFLKSDTREAYSEYWAKRFNFGALAASLAWASSMWVIFPLYDVPYQILLILTLGGVAGGAIASLPYDSKLTLQFQLILLISVESRVLFIGDKFSYEIALFSLFVFAFLISCGKEVGKNYFELVWLKQDVLDKSNSVMSTTERMAQIGFWEWDGESHHIVISENLSSLLNTKNSMINIDSCFKRVHIDDRLKVRNSVLKVRTTEDENTVEFRMISGDEETDYRTMRQVIKERIENNGEKHLLGTVQDITDIKNAEAKIYRMAYHDGLTGLANRFHFHERLEEVIQEAKESNEEFSIVYIDLDNFKGVNDKYGHECGDNYLIKFSDYLKSIVRKRDLVSRLGGDEFCILQGHVGESSDPMTIAERCLDFARKPLQIGNHVVNPQMSIGISTFPQHGLTADEVVKNADLAMYCVKQNGKQNYALFNENMLLETEDQKQLESDLKSALQNEEFELWYQLKVDIQKNIYTGVEALIRWRHPERGIVSPDKFITTAERVGMIKEIGEWVMHTGCMQLHEWNRQGVEVGMAVNISGDHFIHPDFTESVRNVIDSNNIASDCLEIEITESMSKDPVAYSRICGKLQELGVRVAIDDFGTGYSSLSLIGKLPINTLKIDKSFIDDLPEDAGSRLMVKAITDISKGFNYDIVAEGVETASQLSYLRDLGIPYVQGYYFSKPVPAEDAFNLLTSQTPNRFAA